MPPGFDLGGIDEGRVMRLTHEEEAMSAAAEQVTTMTQTAKLKPGQAVIKGRIDARRRFNNEFYTRLVLPAPDEYTPPAVVEVISKDKLGDIGDDWTGCVRIGGRRNSFPATDRDTGERVVVQTANIYLRAE